MLRIFISYRRDDSGGYTLPLYERLSQHFGPEHVFKDIDTIPFGEDFVEHLEQAVGSCDVLIAVIGKQWLNATNDKHQRRLDDPKDYVRLEIQMALKRKIRVIPCLVGGATMPTQELLPKPLETLHRRRAFQISDTRFDSDLESLIQAISSTSSSASEYRDKGKPKIVPWIQYSLIALVIVLGLGLIVAVYQFVKSTGPNEKSQGSELSAKTLGKILDFQETLSTNKDFISVRNAIEACQPLYVSWGGKFDHEVMNQYLNFFENIGHLNQEKLLDLEKIDFYFGAYLVETAAHPHVRRYIQDFQEHGQKDAFSEFQAVAEKITAANKERLELATRVEIACQLTLNKS